MEINNLVIPDNYVIIIISILVLLGVVIITIQWRKVKEYQYETSLLEKQIELKKIAMVEKDLESKRLMETSIPLPKDQQEKLSKIRKGTTNIMQEVGFLHSEVSERLARLEAQTELTKLQNMVNEIETKEKEVDDKLEKIKGE